MKTAIVSIVDDDQSVRESLPDLLRVCGYTVRAFGSAEAFLASDCIRQTRCLVLDVAMPGISGPDLQQELALRGYGIPIIFVTALADDGIRSKLMKQGALECLFKPFSDAALLQAVNEAFRAA